MDNQPGEIRRRRIEYFHRFQVVYVVVVIIQCGFVFNRYVNEYGSSAYRKHIG